VIKKLKTNPLYAYYYKAPIIAVNPNRPMQLEIDQSKVVIYYNQESYEEYLTTKQEAIKAEGSAARLVQCASIPPSVAYLGYGDINPADAIAAQDVVRIRDHEYEDIALHESRISPTINRYIEGDTITEVANKLSSINQSHAIVEIMSLL